MAKIITMPRLDKEMTEGKVEKWYKKIGDDINIGDIIVDIETDKAIMEFESFSEGKILYLGAKEGEHLAVDALLVIIGHEGEDISSFVPSDKKLVSNSTPSDSSKRKLHKVFIGHGRSKLWALVDRFLYREHGIDTLVFESETRVGNSITSIIDGFLNEASIAIIIMTAEDETAEGMIRARQNVIHEIGLFQGRLGFEKVIILKQNNIEEFTNIAGLQYIGFSESNIEHTFYEIQRKLKQEGLL